MTEVKRHLSIWKKYKIVLRKNFLASVSDSGHLIPLILVPFAVLTLFVILRILFPEERLSTADYDPLEFSKSWRDIVRLINYRKEYITRHTQHHNNFSPRIVLGYAPSNYDGVKNIMGLASTYLDDIEVQPSADCDILREEMKIRFYFAGVCFDKLTMDSPLSLVDGLYPLHLNFSIIFPYELRIYGEDAIGTVWKTSNYRKVVTPWDYMNIRKNDYNNFLSEGFLHIQRAILESYTKLTTKGAWDKLVALKRFPLGDRRYDILLFGSRVWIPLGIIIAELYPVSFLTYEMVQEKTKTLKPLMMIMGVENYVIFLAWITQGMVIKFSFSLLLTCILKISWGTDNAFLESTSVLIILLFLFVYDLAALCFCFMFSAFSQNLTNVTANITFFWFLTFVPFLFLIYKDTLHITLRALLNLLPNTALASGFKIILEFGTLGHGMDIINLGDSPTNADELTLGWVILVLLVSVVLYTTIAFIVETLSRRSSGIYFNWKFWAKKDMVSRESFEPSGSRVGHMVAVQIDPEYKSISVELNGVCKQFGGIEVVHHVSFTLYENEITVLMGHNGCGKTTLLSMIAGLIKATSGTIRVKGLNVSLYSKLIDYGISLDNKVLFDHLTVEENLQFFTELKGLNRLETEQELVKYLDKVELSQHRKMRIKHLSSGQRQLLAVCCALTGGSSIVILDEPGTNLDLFSRSKLVELLNSEKTGRSILLTSHYCDTAEAIGDRIIIMSHGWIRCIGNSYFLRKLYGMGYILVILKGPLCSTIDVEKHIKKFIPNAAFHSEIGAEISYLLDSKHTSLFAALLEDIEAHFEELDLTNCTIYENALEHIFYAWGAADPSENSRQRFIAILNGKTIYEDEYNNLLFMKNKVSSGVCLWFNQLKVMLKKRFLFEYYHIYWKLTQLLLTMIFIGIAISEIIPDTSLKSDTMIISLPAQRISRTVVNSRFDESEAIMAVDRYYREAIIHFGYPHMLEDTEGELIADYILDKNVIGQSYLVGATFGYDYIVAWYSRFPMHTASLSLSMVYEAIIRAYVDSHSSIRVSHTELALDRVSLNQADPRKESDILLGLVSFFFIFGWSAVQIFLIEERISKFKRIQFASGVSYSSFWVGTLLYDLIKIIILNVLFVLVFLAVTGIHTFPASFLGWYFFLLCVGGISVTIWNYCAALWHRDPVTALMLTVTFHYFAGLVFCAMIEATFPNANDYIASDSPYIWLLRCLPLFALCTATAKILYIYELKCLCATETMKLSSILMEDCRKAPNCCVDWAVWDWNTGIQPEIVCLCVTALTFIYVLYIIEKSKHWFRSSKSRRGTKSKHEHDFEDHEWRHKSDSFCKEDEAVVKERLKVYRFNTRDQGTQPLVCDSLGKKIGGSAVIKHLFLSLERGEAFGLLGEAGSGKSIFLEMLTGVERIDCGKVYVNGMNVVENLTQLNKQMGLCPSLNPFMLEYRPKEILEMIALIRGVRKQDVGRVCENLVKVLGIFPQYNQQLRYLSWGFRRRFTFAMAVIGNSPILFIDNATAGVDPASRRYLWNVLCRMKKAGTAVLFSTDSTEECELIASRVGFMAHGRFASIGTLSELYKGFSNGYVLTIKLRTELRMNRGSTQLLSILNHRRHALVNFVENSFKSASLRKHDGNQLYFLIPEGTYTLNEIFGTMQRSSYNLHVEDFQISRMKLALVFNDFAEKQRGLGHKRHTFL